MRQHHHALVSISGEPNQLAKSPTVEQLQTFPAFCALQRSPIFRYRSGFAFSTFSVFLRFCVFMRLSIFQVFIQEC